MSRNNFLFRVMGIPVLGCFISPAELQNQKGELFIYTK